MDDVGSFLVFLANIRTEIIEPLRPVLSFITRVIGGVMIGFGLFKMISHERDKGSAALLILFVGTILLNIEQIRTMAGHSITTTALELGDNINPVGADVWREAVKTLFYIAWITGFFAFIFGWRNLVFDSEEKKEMGFIKVLGGVLCMNLPTVISALKAIAPGTPIEKLAQMLGI